MTRKILTDVGNLQVLYEDNHLIAVNKRPGDIVQGDKTGDLPLSEIVKQYLKTKYNKPGNVYLGVAHRIDRPTSGVVIFAKTSKALSRLNKLFAEKNARKLYWAVTKISPTNPEATLTHWLKRNPKQNKSYAHIKPVPGAKEAIMSYKVIKALKRYFLLEIELKTGRHHQIRAQLSFLGCPIKGDLKYGYDRSNSDGSIHLHARELTLNHPVGGASLQFIADPPEDPIWNDCLKF